jgi:hypothetical protein
MAGSALAATALLLAAAGTPAIAAPAAPPAATIAVTSVRPSVDTAVGQHVEYQARIVNSGSTSTGQLLVHLNVASVSSDVYVDPEDWSTDRSRYLPALAPGAATVLSWDLQAVSPGSFAVYAVVLPNPTGSSARQQLSVSSPTSVTVSARRTLNAGGSLPVVIAMPVLLGLATLAARARNRSRRQS